MEDRSKLAKNFDIYETDETKSKPLLFEIAKGALNNQVTRSNKVDVNNNFHTFLTDW